jgi:hypothetical protein
LVWWGSWTMNKIALASNQYPLSLSQGMCWLVTSHVQQQLLFCLLGTELEKPVGKKQSLIHSFDKIQGGGHLTSFVVWNYWNRITCCCYATVYCVELLEWNHLLLLLKQFILWNYSITISRQFVLGLSRCGLFRSCKNKEHELTIMVAIKKQKVELQHRTLQLPFAQYIL